MCRLIECKSVRNAGSGDGGLKQVKERSKCGEVIPSARICVSINIRAACVWFIYLLVWWVTAEDGGALHSSAQGCCAEPLMKEVVDKR